LSIINYTEEEFKHRKLLGQRIVELRHKYRMTQEELADKIKIAPRSLSEIENGKCSAIGKRPVEVFENNKQFQSYQCREQLKIK